MTEQSSKKESSKTLTELIEILYKDPDNHFPGPALDEEIRELEEQLGTSVPISYIQFLKKFGGGNFKNIRLFSIASEDESFYDFMEQVYFCSKSIPLVFHGELLPFGDDYAGNVYCFDLHHARDGENTIVQWDQEFDDESEPRHIAQTFAEFIEKTEFNNERED